MKFTKGTWLNRDGVQFHNMAQVRQTRVEGNKLYAYTVPYLADARAVGGPVMEMYISAPQPNCIRTEVYHFMGSGRRIPSFELNIADITPEFEDTDAYFSVTSGDTKLVVTKRPCTFTYYYKGRKLTSVGKRFGETMISTVSVQDDDFMNRQLNLELTGGDGDGDAFRCRNFMCVQMDVDIGEKIYGLGERFTPFVKNGQSLTTWNEDGGTSTDIAYKNIPFYVTNRNCGVLVNDVGPVSYEICSEQVSKVQFSVPGEKIDFVVIGGGSMKDVLSGYAALTGKPALPPAWSFGLWLTTSSTEKYDEATVMELVDGMRSRSIPLHVFMYDAFSTRENEWCSFQWDRSIFPHIEEQLKRLKETEGIHPSYWLNSYIAQKSPLFREAMRKGYLLKKPNGDVWQWDL